MNAEIYLIRGGSAASECGTDAFNKKMKALAENNICVLYKTAVDNNEKAFKQALKMSSDDEEGIDLIIVADALKEASKENAEEFLGAFQVKKDNIVETSVEIGSLKAEKSESENNEKVSEAEKAEKKRFNVYSAKVGGKNAIRVVLLPTVESVGEEFHDILYNAVYSLCVEDKPKKGGFFRNFIPMKGDRPLEVVRKTILMIAIVTFLVSGYLLVDQLIIKPMIADNTNSGIKDLLVEGNDSDDNDYNAVAPKRKKIVIGESEVLPDFEKLLNENKDTVGWIKIPNTRIDYVVCQSQDPEQPEFYLKHDFYGNYSDYGTIFLDYRSPLDAQNLIIHGHHMNDGRMFADLMNYQDFDFYKSTPAFTFNTIYEKAKWKIISVYKTNTLESQGEFFNYLRGTFETESDFMNYIYQVRARSLFNCPVDVNEDDTLLTLSTCAYDFDEFRFVVVARRVREGETAKVDTSKATYNPNPLYPDIWYKAKGGRKPTVTSFEEALKAGEITWYDNPHNKKWTASEEQIEATKQKKEKEKKEEAETSAKAAAEKLKNAKDELNSANSYIEVAKRNLDSLTNIYDNLKSAVAAGKSKYSEAMTAANKISSAKTESELRSIITLLQEAKRSNAGIDTKANSLTEWKTAIVSQSDQAIKYADAALKYSSEVKGDAENIKDSAKKYKTKVNDMIKKSNDAVNGASERIKKIDAQITAAGKALTKLRAEQSSKPAESSKPEPSKPVSSKPESSKPESSKQTESSEEGSREAAGTAA